MCKQECAPKARYLPAVVHACINAHVCVCACMWVYVCVSVCMYVYMYFGVCVCIYIVEARKLEHGFRTISARIPYTLP